MKANHYLFNLVIRAIIVSSFYTITVSILNINVEAACNVSVAYDSINYSPDCPIPGDVRYYTAYFGGIAGQAGYAIIGGPGSCALNIQCCQYGLEYWVSCMPSFNEYILNDHPFAVVHISTIIYQSQNNPYQCEYNPEPDCTGFYGNFVHCAASTYDSTDIIGPCWEE